MTDARLSAATEGAPELRLEWRVGSPTKPWSEEWFIAETIWGDRVVLRALPEEWTYDFKTADDTYIKHDKIKRWMQFPDSEYIAPAPLIPDNAQAAGMREALQFALNELSYIACKHGYVSTETAIIRVKHALAPVEMKQAASEPPITDLMYLKQQSERLSVEDQHALAEFIAPNLGMVLVNEPPNPDCPHERSSSAETAKRRPGLIGHTCSSQYVIRELPDPNCPACTDPLHDLVARFARALLAKLKLAEANGKSGWEQADWEEHCQRGLLHHVEKGDPRDVAAYCAFAWHHGWVTRTFDEPQSSADTAELDFSDALTSRIMGAARLHTHDHEMACNITREVLAVLSSHLPQPTRETIAREIQHGVSGEPRGALLDAKFLKIADAILALSRPQRS